MLFKIFDYIFYIRCIRCKAHLQVIEYLSCSFCKKRKSKFLINNNLKDNFLHESVAVIYKTRFSWYNERLYFPFCFCLVSGKKYHRSLVGTFPKLKLVLKRIVIEKKNYYVVRNARWEHSFLQLFFHNS